MEFKKKQAELLYLGKPFLVIQNVKDKYSNLASQASTFSQIKRQYYSNPNYRLKSYEPTIKKIIMENPVHKKKLENFKNKKPFFQVKIKKKISKGMDVYGENVDNLILKIPLFHDSVDKYIKLPDKDASKLRKVQMKALNNKHYNIKIIDGQKLMDKLLPGLLINNDLKKNIVATLLATGRRQNELVNGIIKKSKKGNYFAIFEGQSKIGLDLKRDSYEIPLLAPFNIVEKAWKVCNEYFKDAKEREKFKIKIRNISRWIKKNPFQLENNIDKLHELRSIYSLICYQLFPTGRLSQMAYISSVLGEASVNVATHYNSIKVINIENLWIPDNLKVTLSDWKTKDKHTKMIVEPIKNYITNKLLTGDLLQINKTLIGKISGKSKNVINRFYNENKNKINQINQINKNTHEKI